MNGRLRQVKSEEWRVESGERVSAPDDGAEHPRMKPGT